MTLARGRGRLLSLGLRGRRALLGALARSSGVSLRLRRGRALPARRSLRSRLFGSLGRRRRRFVRRRRRRLGRTHVQRGLEAGEVLAEVLDLHRVLELARRLLEAQREEGLRPLLHLRGLLVGGPVEHRLDLHVHLTAARKARETNRVAIAILSASSLNASRAVFWSTPSISNRMRAGLTTHTQPSGAPLPLPIRVSSGFFVIGLSGNTRIQSFPPRLTWRWTATRPASIWRAVSQPGSSACSPYSPKESSEPRSAVPRMRPRCCVRYLTLDGINMGVVPYATFRRLLARWRSPL